MIVSVLVNSEVIAIIASSKPSTCLLDVIPTRPFKEGLSLISVLDILSLTDGDFTS